MSVVINGTGSISGLSNVGGIDLPQSGNVLQVVNTTIQSNSGGSYFSTASTTYVAVTGITLSITPKFSTSKILVMVNMVGQVTTAYGGATIFKNGSNVAPGGGGSGGNLAMIGGSYTGNAEGSLNMMFMDYPATTSSITYDARIATSANTIYISPTPSIWSGGAVQITAMEIAA